MTYYFCRKASNAKQKKKTGKRKQIKECRARSPFPFNEFLEKIFA